MVDDRGYYVDRMVSAYRFQAMIDVSFSAKEHRQNENPQITANRRAKPLLD